MLFEIHGWDARERQWHAPTLIHPNRAGRAVARRILGSGSWYGKMVADIPGEPRLSFIACIHDLGDSALGVLDLPGAEGGPLQYVLAVPTCRRRTVRPELAFEFVSFMRFLEGANSSGAELELHDYVERALQSPDSGALAFSVESRPQPMELQLLLSQQAERLAMGMILALEERDEVRQAVAAD